MSDTFRIHPAIGFARVGTSDEHYLAPETLAGHPTGNGPTTGGLPIKAGTEGETIRSSDLRDPNGALKRQAARFRIYQHAAGTCDRYPSGQQVEEIGIGSAVTIGGETRKVKDVVWTVHMANKKTAWFESPDDTGIFAWGSPEYPKRPPLRNPHEGNPLDSERLTRLVTDPGPRAIRGTNAAAIQLDTATPASHGKGGEIVALPEYPKTFPEDAFPVLNPPGVAPIETLGELRTDDHGRLIVVPGFGRANSFNPEGPRYGFDDAVNNDWWFDDTGDGPVSATLVLDDGSLHEVRGAWVISTDPAYAPQILNAVSLWDDIYDSWIRKLGLRTDFFKTDATGKDGGFKAAYQPSFDDEVQPIFLAAGLQRWIADLGDLGTKAHARVEAIAAREDPADTQLGGLGMIRKPVDPEDLNQQPDISGDDRRMPLSLGDSGRSRLSVTQTQYFFLDRWDAGQAKGAQQPLNPAELLDKAALMPGLGGRFSPGIDMTYICREPDIYIHSWQTAGPFRIKPRALEQRYAGARSGQPVLSLGWIPRRDDQTGLEPGDISKFMAIPWHADYNSCAVHLPDPNPRANNTLYWSWPAQRPVSVYVAGDVKARDDLPPQRFSVRGPGTKTKSEPVLVRERDTRRHRTKVGPADPAEVGRYQEPIDILDNWMKIGTVLQATAIDDGRDYDPTHYLEVEGQLDGESDAVRPWPTTVKPGAGGP